MPDERLSFSRALDRALLCEKRGYPTFSNFLNPLSAQAFHEILEKECGIQLMLYGGAMGCERLMLGFFSEYDKPLESAFPIAALEITYSNAKLTHRDFLGAILGTGVSRERVGDVFIFPGKALVLLEREIADHVLSAITSVGRTAVSAALVADDYLIAPFTEGTRKAVVVSSMRVDAVIAAAFNISRGKALKLIEKEKAFINWQGVSSASKLLAEGDTITLRGVGRAKVEEIGSKTKKDNISINLLLSQGL